MKRREFIQSSALLGAAMFAMPSVLQAAKGKSPVGLQLYTLRDVINSDVKGILRKVSEYGYKELETYGYRDGKLFGMSAKEFSTYVKSLGMKVTSGHYGTDLVQKGWEQACADAKAMGQKYVVVPWMNKEFYSSLDALKKTCDMFNKAGEVANKHGLRMGYHNHAFEFEQVEGKVIFDAMLEYLNPKAVSMEMDIYWVVRAGQDPIKYFEKYPGRFEQWHVKDMDKSDKDKNADVGTGSIDFKAIFAKAKVAGMKHYYIEQESYPGAPIDSVANSIKTLRTII